MKKLVYEYSNGIEKVHTTYVNKKTMLKEAEGAERVSIYKCDEYEVEAFLFEDMNAGEYITTLSLR